MNLLLLFYSRNKWFLLLIASRLKYAVFINIARTAFHANAIINNVILV